MTRTPDRQCAFCQLGPSVWKGAVILGFDSNNDPIAYHRLCAVERGALADPDAA